MVALESPDCFHVSCFLYRDCVSLFQILFIILLLVQQYLTYVILFGVQKMRVAKASSSWSLLMLAMEKCLLIQSKKGKMNLIPLNHQNRKRQNQVGNITCARVWPGTMLSLRMKACPLSTY